MTHLVGRPLIKLNFDQQRYEADFRFSLVRLRENAEEVTLLAGEPAEEERLLDRFGRVVRNWYGIMQPHQAAHLPHRRLFAGRHHLPVHRGEPALFRRLDDAWRADADRVRLRPGAGRAVVLRQGLSEIADWKAVLNRLAGFDASMDWAKGLDTDRAARQLM